MSPSQWNLVHSHHQSILWWGGEPGRQTASARWSCSSTWARPNLFETIGWYCLRDWTCYFFLTQCEGILLHLVKSWSRWGADIPSTISGPVSKMQWASSWIGTLLVGVRIRLPFRLSKLLIWNHLSLNISLVSLTRPLTLFSGSLAKDLIYTIVIR